ncbi:MAG: DUF1214 domain-containing protein [Pseudomonadota bacterium]
MKVKHSLLLGSTAFLLSAAAGGWVSVTLTKASLAGPDGFENSFEAVSGAWMYSGKVGSPAASRAERARVALGGPLALSSEETIYFIALEDDEGEQLTSSCDYRITGQPFDTRWWSLTLYDSDTQVFVPNEINRASWNSRAIEYAAEGSWTVIVSDEPQVGHWLPVHQQSTKRFDLLLRLYNPAAETRRSVRTLALPTIERVQC